MSEVIDIALDRLIATEELRRDVAGYLERPVLLIRRLGRASQEAMEAACRALATATGCPT